MVPKWGQFSLYPGGGYVADLGYEKNETLEVMKTLHRHGWLDRQSRSLILEFSTFNPSTNLLVVANYFYELQPSGLKALFERIETISLYSKEKGLHQFHILCFTFFNVFVLLYMGRVCYNIYKQPRSFFKVLWNWIEVLLLVFSVLAVVLNVMRSSEAILKITKLRQNVFANVNFQEVIVWGEAENGVLGFLIFLITIKLLRFIRYNKQVAIFSVTLKAWSNSLPSFLMVFVISFVAFMHFGILVFGTGTARYSSILKATYFQLELILGKVKKRPIEELSDTNRTFGRIFAASILLSLTVLFMNLFISQLNDVLSSAKSSVIPNKLCDITDEPGSYNNGMRKTFFDKISYNLRQRTGAKSPMTCAADTDNSSNKSNEIGTMAFDSSKPRETLTSRKGKETFFDKISYDLRKRTGAKSPMTCAADTDNSSNKSNEMGTTAFDSSKPKETLTSRKGKETFFDKISYDLRKRTGAKSPMTCAADTDNSSKKSNEKGTTFDSSEHKRTLTSRKGKKPLHKNTRTIKTKSPFPELNKTYRLSLNNGRMQEKLPVIEEEMPASDPDSREQTPSFKRKGKETND